MQKGAYDIVLIGGSAGSLEMVLQIVPKLSRELQFSIVIVLHRKNTDDQLLIEILSRRTELTVKEAEDKEPILPGIIYVASADYHLLIERDRSFSLDASERINYSRPSIDATFQTGAEAYGDRAVGILLSGANEDGAEGLATIKHFGGLVAVQDPEAAPVALMPQLALNKISVDAMLNENNLEKFIQAL